MQSSFLLEIVFAKVHFPLSSFLQELILVAKLVFARVRFWLQSLFRLSSFLPEFVFSCKSSILLNLKVCCYIHQVVPLPQHECRRVILKINADFHLMI